MAERLRACPGCVFTIGGCPFSVIGCLRSIGGRPRPVPPRPCQDVLPTRVLVVLQIVEAGQRITTLGTAITKLGCPITLLRRSQPRRSSLVTHRRHGRAVATRPLSRKSAPLVADPVTAGGQNVVSGVLIVIRCSLIACARGLVVIGPRLILITRRLVSVRRRLILVTPGLAVIDDGVGQKLDATSAAARNRAYLTASWTPNTFAATYFPSPTEL